MKKIMTPSSITDGQISKIQELIGAALRKSTLKGGNLQQILEHQGRQVVGEMLAALYKYVNEVNNMIVRHIVVNRGRTSQEALSATGRRLDLEVDVIASMPQGEDSETDVYFFQLNRNDVDGGYLKARYELFNLVPVDPFALAAVNEEDPTFGDMYRHPNCTQWKDSNGKWCYAVFGYEYPGGCRTVRVVRGSENFGGGLWFAGVLKKKHSIGMSATTTDLAAELSLVAESQGCSAKLKNILAKKPSLFKLLSEARAQGCESEVVNLLEENKNLSKKMLQTELGSVEGN